MRFMLSNKMSGMSLLGPNIRSKSTYWDKNKGDYRNKLILFENILNRFRVSRCNIVEVIALATRSLRLEVKEIKQFIWVIYSRLLHIKIPLWVTAYDDYPMHSIREKERMIPYFIQQQYWFLFYHDETTLL